MRSSFKILFSLEVLNSFFSTGRWSQVKVVPMPETEKLLKQHELGTRQIDNEFLVFAKTDSGGKVFNAPALHEKFSFMLIPQSANFLSYTNFPLKKMELPVFHFSNLNGNEAGGKHFISKAIKDYSNSTSYLPGDFAKSLVDGKIYESIRVNSSGPGSIVPDDAQAEPSPGAPVPPEKEDKLYSKNFWVLHNDMQFANGNDTKEIDLGVTYDIAESGPVYNFQTTLNQKKHSVQVFSINPATLMYDKVVVSAQVVFEDNYNVVQVDMRQVPDGKYLVRVNDDVKIIYLNKIASGAGMPMFIDIYNLPDTNAQAIIDAAQKPKRTKFTIAFAARRVLWQYKTRTNTIDKIEDTGGSYAFKPNGMKKFVSLRPIPLSDAAFKTLVAKGSGLNIMTPLPNPSAANLLDKQNEIFTTEAFINF